MSIINVRLVGGLGNQLYQFSFGMLLAQKIEGSSIHLDISGMRNYREVWGFMLPQILDFDKMLVSCSVENNFWLKARLPKLTRYFPKCGLQLGFVSDVNGGEAVKHLPSSMLNNIFVDGYFEYQSFVPSYVKLVEPIVRPQVKVEFPQDVLVVNVRGGELARLGVTSLNDREQYRTSIDKMVSEQNLSKIHLITDDVIFSKQLLNGICEIQHIYAPDPIENFRLLLSAKNKILSRSTFAKWAGYLSSSGSNIIWL